MGRYIWAYWLSPFAYLMRGVVINEMTSPAWRTPVVTADGTTTTTGNVGLLVMHGDLTPKKFNHIMEYECVLKVYLG
jgi:hypothetical protein